MRRLATVVIFLALASGCGMDISKSNNAEFAFETTFGHKPSSSITSLQGEKHSFRDSGHCYLSFQCPRNEFNGLLHDSFTSIAKPEFSQMISNAGIRGPTPTWWSPLTGTSSSYWTSINFHPTFSSGRAIASYDETTMTAHIYWDGLD